MSSHVEECKREMMAMMKKINGLIAIVITDRDGVPLIRVTNETITDISSRPSFMSPTFSTGLEQASKLGIGECATIISHYDNYQIVHFNKDKLIIALVAYNKTNTGLLLALENEFDIICNELRACVD